MSVDLCVWKCVGAAKLVNRRELRLQSNVANEWQPMKSVVPCWLKRANKFRVSEKKKKFKFRATRRFNEILFFFFEIFRSRRRNKRKTVARHRRTLFFFFFWALTVRPKTERSGLFFLAGPSTVFFFLYFNEAIRCAVVVGPNFIWRVVYLFRMSGHLKSRPLLFYSADKMSSLIQILAPINSRRDIFPKEKIIELN